VECRRARTRRRAVQCENESHEQKKKNDQDIDFLRSLPFRSPIGIEIVLIQTHSFYRGNIMFHLAGKHYPILSQIPAVVPEPVSQTGKTPL
jgi:hypothetical protein